MGANNVQIKLNQTHEYVGQVNNNKPQGKGNLYIYSSKSKCSKDIIWNIAGQFRQGELIKCKAENPTDKLIYEGDVKNGKFTGHGQLSHDNSRLIWQGQFQNGTLVSGQIKKQSQYYCKGLFTYQHDNNHNKEDKQKQLYKLKGESFFINLENKQKLIGSFDSGQLTGTGAYQFYNGDCYKGLFKKGLMQGVGVYKSKTSQIKEISGVFTKSQASSHSKSSDQPHRIEFKNGDIFQGNLKQNKMHGSDNVYYFSDGSMYKGSFNSDSLTGQCEITYGKRYKIQRYKGEVLDGMFNGLGVLQYKNGVILKGYFLKNCKNGPCIIIYGQRMFKCLYIMDQLMGQMVQVPYKQH